MAVAEEDGSSGHPPPPPEQRCSLMEPDRRRRSHPHSDRNTAAAAALEAEEIVPQRFCHPTTRRLLAWRGGALWWIAYIPVMGKALTGFGPGLVLSLNLTELLSKGMANNLLFYSFLPMFMYRFQCGSVEYQRLYSVGGMGWSAKPLAAVFSDSVALFGYRKRWLLVFSALFAAVCCFGYAMLPRGNSSAMAGISLYTIANYCMANIDIFTEGLYSRKIRHVPAEGVFLISSMWWMSMIGGMVGAFIQGPLSDEGHATVGGWVAGGCLMLIAPIFGWNGLEEKRNREEKREDAEWERKDNDGDGAAQEEQGQRCSPQDETCLDGDEADLREAYKGGPLVDPTPPPAPCDVEEMGLLKPRQEAERVMNGSPQEEGEGEEEEGEEEEGVQDLTGRVCCRRAIEFNAQLVYRQYRLVMLCLGMTAAVLGLAVATMVAGTYPLLAATAGTSAVVVLLLFWALPRVVAKAGLFSFLSHALYVNLTGPLNSFYLAGPDCVPNGPHFDLFFLYSISAAVGNFAGLIGVTLFAYIFSHRSYRFTFFVTTVLRAMASVFDLILVRRWNLAARIPDAALYFLGDAVVYQLVYRLSWMPMTILIAQLCPRGSEAMVYATLAAVTNLGGTMASEIASLLLETFWPVHIKEPHCNFDNLWKLVVAGHMVLPLAVCGLIILCIPNKRVSDPLRW